MGRRKKQTLSNGIEAEFEGAELPDAGLVARLMGVAGQIAGNAVAALPEALETEAALEAGYRLFNNQRVQAQVVLEPHRAQTAGRAAAHHEIVAVHDTTLMEFRGETKRRGLGPLRK